MRDKHIATYPLFGSFPISGNIDTCRRIGTGFIHRVEEIEKTREHLEARGHPLRLRWLCAKHHAAEHKGMRR